MGVTHRMRNGHPAWLEDIEERDIRCERSEPLFAPFINSENMHQIFAYIAFFLYLCIAFGNSPMHDY